MQNLIICCNIADVNDHLNVPTHNPSPQKFFFNLELDNGKIKAGLIKEVPSYRDWEASLLSIGT